jgi:RNA polymerase sigma-70 factor (ECF subfamily)
MRDDGTQSDAELVHEALSGRSDALEILWGRYAERVKRRLSGLLGAQDAEDLVQETFIRMTETLSRFDLSRPFGPWILTMARRLGMDHLRRQRRKWDAVSLDDSSEGDGPRLELADPRAEGALERLAREDLVHEALMRVGPKQREVLVRHYYHGLTEEEIAAALNVPQNTVHSRLRCARERIRALLEAEV